MHALYWQPQLSALALLQAHRTGSYEAVISVIADTPPLELHNGLVQLADGLISSMAAKHGVTYLEMVDVFRQGMLAAASVE